MTRITVDGAVLRFAVAGEAGGGMDREAWEELARLGRSVRTAGASCVVLHGQGPTFCAGDRVDTGERRDVAGDRLDVAGTVRSGDGDGTEERRRRVADLLAPALRAVIESEVPVVAAVGGTARDEGLVLALAADARILAGSASLEVTGPAGPGPLPAGLGWLLTRRAPSLVGPLVFGSGRVGLPAAGAVAAAVVEDGELDGAAMALARDLGRHPVAVRARRAAVGRVTEEELGTALAFDAELAAVGAAPWDTPGARREGGGDA